MSRPCAPRFATTASCFRPQQSALLQQQRGLALQAMQRIAGIPAADSSGRWFTATARWMPSDCWLFADTPEQVMLYMADRHMPWQAAEVTLHYSGGQTGKARPALDFLAGETRVELVVLDDQSHSDPPRDPITGGRLEMLGIDELDALTRSSRRT